MNKVTIISGYQGSGKSTKVREIVNGRNSETFTDYKREADLRRLVNEKPGFTGVPENVAIFDEVRSKDVPRLLALINSNSILVRKAYTPKPEYYERPEMIILTTDPKLEIGTPFGTGHFIEYINLNGR